MKATKPNCLARQLQARAKEVDDLTTFVDINYQVALYSDRHLMIMTKRPPCHSGPPFYLLHHAFSFTCFGCNWVDLFRTLDCPKASC